jgi:hypothetical protein
LVVDDTSVYWANYGGVWKVPKDGSALATLAVKAPNLSDLRVDADNVYLRFDNGVSQLAAAPKNGSPIVTLAKAPALPSLPMAIDDHSVYWADGSVRSIPKVGGTIITYEMGSPIALASDGTALFIASSNAIQRVAVGGMSPIDSTVAGAQAGDIGLDADHVYYHSSDGLRRIPKTGGLSELIASFNDSVGPIVVDGDLAYFISYRFAPRGGPNGSELHAVSLSGGGDETLCEGDFILYSLAVDQTSIYFGSFEDIFRLAR